MMSRASQDRTGVVVASAYDEHQGRALAEVVTSRPPSDAGWKASETVSDLPAWVGDLLARGDEASAACRHRSIRVEQAAGMSPAAFEIATRDAYRRILDGLDADEPWRAWNFIPRINDDASQGGVARDRYMAFNAGRHRGFADVQGGEVRYPVASGVGHEGDDLVIHLLHGRTSPRVVDNPRQVKPDEYSDRYGDPPPAFARACLVDLPDSQALLVSGTASVVGEASLHEEDFSSQLEETLRNIETILRCSWPEQGLSVISDWLVYLPDPIFARSVQESIIASDPGQRTVIDIRKQPLCRPELLVEIECAAFRAAGEGTS